MDQKLVTDQLVLTVGYDIENLKGQTAYKGEVTRDRYGRAIPKHAHGTANLDEYTSSTKRIVTAALELHMAINGEYAGHIVISDIVKPNSQKAISELKAAGVEKTVMLTGDARKVAEQVASSLKIDTVYKQFCEFVDIVCAKD